MLTRPSALRHNRQHFGLERFTPHDLRRTAATHLGSVGVDRFHSSRVLGHADREITGVYDRYAYDQEKRVALTRWERKLRAVLSGEKVPKVISIEG